MARPECPCITVTPDKISFNVFCMRKFAGVSYVQLLLHPDSPQKEKGAFVGIYGENLTLKI